MVHEFAAVGRIACACPGQARKQTERARTSRPLATSRDFQRGQLDSRSSAPLAKDPFVPADTAALTAAPQADIYVPVIATVEDPVAAQRRISQLKAAYPGLIDAVAGVNTELVRSPDGTPWYRTYLLPARS